MNQWRITRKGPLLRIAGSLNEANVKLYHILREANRCADKTAKLGATLSEHCVRVLIPPDDVVEDLMADMVGAAS